MRAWGFLFLLFISPAAKVFGQTATLPGASIQATFLQEEAPKIEIAFGERRVIARRRSDESLSFGKCQGTEAVLLNGKPLGSGSRGRTLDEPTWVRDGEGRGFYFPAQRDVQVTAKESTLSLQSLVPYSPTTAYWVEFGKISARDLEEKATLMTNPTLAPLQMTENDDEALIVYDALTKTTAYALFRSSEKMSSEGYLSGVGQAGVALIRSNARKLVLSGGKDPSGTMRLKLFGDWTPAATETNVLSCESKAGRTWIEFSAAPEGSAELDLVELPDKGFLRRIIDLFAS